MLMASRPFRSARFRNLKAEGLPQLIISSVAFLLNGRGGGAEPVASAVESRREDIARGGSQLVEVLYSPKPGSSGSEPTAEIRPAPGVPLNFTMERVARTGKDKTWGSVLYILARESRAKVILELGSCAGISAAYLASSEYCEVLHTVEGSASLSHLACETLQKIKTKAKVKVHNALFDDALDDLLPELPYIDFVFIDGHHEKIATIHYWERISQKMRPGTVVVFDDIAWSEDMRDAWISLSQRPEFADVVDFGPIGVCICGEKDSGNPKYWDLQTVIGKRRVGSPHGWSRETGDVVA